MYTNANAILNLRKRCISVYVTINYENSFKKNKISIEYRQKRKSVLHRKEDRQI